MYDSSRIKQQNDIITLDDILSKVTEYDIYSRYIGHFKIGLIYNSPFRKDKNPSFGIFYSKKSGRLLFKDHGTGECGDVIKFVSLYTGITNYNDILNRIVKDLNITNNTVLKASKEYKIPTETVIGVVRQDWTNVDKQYWSQFGITIDTLKNLSPYSPKAFPGTAITPDLYIKSSVNSTEFLYLGGIGSQR